MTHWRSLLDPSIYLGAQDLPKDTTLVISRVVREKLPDRKDEAESSAPMLYFAGKDGGERTKRWKVPKSCMYALNLLFGSEIEGWAGKTIVLYAAKCMSFGEVEDCVRLRLPAEVEAKVYAWLKKRKASKSAYLFKDGAP